MPIDRKKAEEAIVAFLVAMGQDPKRDPELRETAARVTAAWATDLIDGYDVDVARMLKDESSEAPSGALGVVSVRDLATSTMCPHHLLPARGTATVVYVPAARITGIGTIARVVDAFAHRLILQEAIGNGVVAALLEHLGARGAACKLDFTHSCLASRGERQHGATVQTIAMGGTFEVSGKDRDLAIAALGSGD